MNYWSNDRQDVVALYAVGQDDHQGDARGTLETWENVVTDDGVIDYTAGGFRRAPWRELASWMRGDETNKGLMNGSFARWQHMLGLPIVKIDGDAATARTDLFATHTSLDKTDGGYHFYDACTFHDELARTSKGWRVSFRKLVLHWGDALPVRPGGFAVE